jgi:SAM-dependent methyltransferase
VGPKTIADILSRLPNDRSMMLQMQYSRQAIARDRADYLLNHGALKKFSGPDVSIAHNTLEYNLSAFEPGSAPHMERPLVLINAIQAIERVARNKAQLRVLTIGPRSEYEILALHAAGFASDKTRGLDLFSYSPFIDVGDMHALPYENDTFDVVLLSFALCYSKKQNVVADEILRVSKNRAIVAIGDEYKDEHDNENRINTFRDEATYVNSCDHILDLFCGHVKTVFVRHEPEPPDNITVVAVFELSKTGNEAVG